MAESKGELAVAQLVDYLNEIEGDGGATYWLTPVAVRADQVDLRLLDSSVEAVYAVTPEGTEEQRATNDGAGCIYRIRASFILTLLARLNQSTDDPFHADPPVRQTVQERMLADVRRKLRADPSLGGNSMDLVIADTEKNTRDTTIEAGAWALAFMRVVVTYHETKQAA